MDSFLIKWLLSFVVGSVWVVVSTLVAERVSGKLGGLIVGLPSTAVVSLLFIGFTQGVDTAVKASLIIPLSSGLYCFFFLSFLILSKKEFKKALIGSLMVWSFFAIVASRIEVTTMVRSVVVWLILVIASILWVNKNITVDSRRIPNKKVSSSVWFKALLSGAIISGVVVLSKIAGPTWGGIFATFPALTVTTLLITLKSRSLEFTRLVAQNIFVSTTITVGLFAVFAYVAFPTLVIWLGTFVSYLALLVVSLPIYFLFNKLGVLIE